ncbi:MAG: hypothetical protein QOI64_2082 [Solirubrobacteraceae bacterium]|nr:hypothetical protein [Solirubrobacteraceae bacterium]
MSLHSGIDGSDPARPQPIEARAGAHEYRHASRPWRLGPATLACPTCDAPISLGGRSVKLTAHVDCPFCRHTAPLRDFLSLAAPARPNRVEIRMIPRARAASGRR